MNPVRNSPNGLYERDIKYITRVVLRLQLIFITAEQLLRTG